MQGNHRLLFQINSSEQEINQMDVRCSYLDTKENVKDDITAGNLHQVQVRLERTPTFPLPALSETSGLETLMEIISA